MRDIEQRSQILQRNMLIINIISYLLCQITLKHQMTQMETTVLPVVWTSPEIQQTRLQQQMRTIQYLKQIFQTKISIINIISNLLYQIVLKQHMTQVETTVLPVVWTSPEIQQTRLQQQMRTIQYLKQIFQTKISIINIISNLLYQITLKQHITQVETTVLAVVWTSPETQQRYIL